MSTIVDFSIVPMDKGESVSAYVARAVTLVRDSGLVYKLNPMGTSIEGEWSEVMGVVDQCFKELQKDCGRIYMTIRVDYRKDTKGRIDGKVASVEAKL